MKISPNYTIYRLLLGTSRYSYSLCTTALYSTLGTFCPLGCFVPWDVLSVLSEGCFALDRFFLGHFVFFASKKAVLTKVASIFYII